MPEHPICGYSGTHRARRFRRRGGGADRSAVWSLHDPETEDAAMHAAVSQKREEIAALCQRYGAVRLEVFGSAARDGDFDPARSDADFLVSFDPDSDLGLVRQYFDLARALRRLLGRDVDLVIDRGIRNRYLRESINASRELVYAA